MKALPKSYLNGSNEREGFSQNEIYLLESDAAQDAGDFDAAWAWLALADIPAYALMGLKQRQGADFIRKWGFNTEEAEQLYGKDWLEEKG